MVDIKDNQIGSIEEEFASLISLLLSTALLNGRLSKHFETNTGYDLNICLYYCQFDYCFLVMHWYLAASRLQSSRPMHRAILTKSCRADGKTLRVTSLFLLDSVPHCNENLLGRISLSCKRRFLLCLLELVVYFAFEL